MRKGRMRRRTVLQESVPTKLNQWNVRIRFSRNDGRLEHALAVDVKPESVVHFTLVGALAIWQPPVNLQRFARREVFV